MPRTIRATKPGSNHVQTQKEKEKNESVADAAAVTNHETKTTENKVLSNR